jgi:predicted metal-dependent HD superfamily phosphohydrolase
MNNSLATEIENYIFEYYRENAPSENVYHNLAHVKYVAELVVEFGKSSNLSNEDIEILKIAAWFHDIGHMETWSGHEDISANFAKDYLTKKEYPSTQIDKIVGCIIATQIPHEPKNHLEEIICDADIAHIGSKNFFDQSDLLKLEIEKREAKKISDIYWLKKNIDFLTENQFFTKYAKLKFDERKNSNLIKLQKKYNKKLDKKNQEKAKDEKLAVEKEKLANKAIDSKKSDRGIETMFRNVIRTHVSFSSMADNKANIMISVNTLLLGAVFTILARKLDTNPHLIIPTIVLTIVSLVTLIMAVRVTRPSISAGLFTKDDIKNKNTNLLFFGNFYKMNLKDFTWGMNEMMEDKDFLYGSMIKDFYYLGQVLGQKYKLLRISYTIFMYGITLASILFAIFVWLNPNPTDLNNIID